MVKITLHALQRLYKRACAQLYFGSTDVRLMELQLKYKIIIDEGNLFLNEISVKLTLHLQQTTATHV
jgi:hypothetical protein